MSALSIGNVAFTSSVDFSVVGSHATKTYTPLRGAPITLPSGRAISTFQFTLNFPNAEAIENELLPLIAMYRSVPIVNVEFDPLRAKMGVMGTMLCGLTNLNVTTVPGQVESARAVAQLAWCEWRGLSRVVEPNPAIIGVFVEQAKTEFRMQYYNYGDVALYHKIVGDVRIPADDPDLVTSVVRFNVSNTFATIPIVENVYPRLQHLGGSLLSGGFVLTSPGPNHIKLRETANFFEEVSHTMVGRRYQGTTAEGRDELLVLKVSNPFLNMCGLHSAILDTSSIEHIPSTTKSLEYAIEFMDVESLSMYEGYNPAFRTTDKDVENAAGQVYLKFRDDQAYQDAILDFDPDLWHHMKKWIRTHGRDVVELSVHDYYRDLNDEEKAEFAKSLKEDFPGFTQSKLAPEMKKAIDAMALKPTRRSYYDFRIKEEQEPYDVFTEQHEVDHAGLKTAHKARKEKFEFGDPNTYSGLEASRPDLYSLVEQDLSEFITFDARRNRLAELYPVVKIYLVDRDDRYQPGHGDDFFEVTAVDDLMLIQSKELPSAVLTATVQNFFGKYAVGDTEVARTVEGDDANEETVVPGLQGTTEDNKFGSIPITPGVYVQVRYGYTNDAENLEIIFNGIISDVNARGEAIQFVAHDAGMALASPIGDVPAIFRSHQDDDGEVSMHTTDPADSESLKNLMKRYRDLPLTRADAMALFYLIKANSPEFNYPEVSAWFSRWRYRIYKFQNKATNIFDPPKWDTMQNKELIRDHIFRNMSMPPYLPVLEGFKPPPDLVGIIYNTTPWDLLNELVDMYPGTCITTRPYENETTVYIGEPDRDPIVTAGALEANSLDNPNRTKVYKTFIKAMGGSFMRDWVKQEMTGFLDTVPYLNEREREKYSRWMKEVFNDDALTDSYWLNWQIFDKEAEEKIRFDDEYIEKFAAVHKEFQLHLTRRMDEVIRKTPELQGSILPSTNIENFRRTHYADSSYNLIFNNIKENNMVYNAVAVNWMSAKSVGGEPIYDPDNEVLIHLPKVKTEDMNVQHYQPRNVFDKDMATRVGVSLLLKEMNHYYDGEFGITSQRHVRPYDYVYVNDMSSRIFGNVEVRDSILYANKENGIMYIIVPDMIARHSVRPTNEIIAEYPWAPASRYHKQVCPASVGGPIGDRSGLEMWVESLIPRCILWFYGWVDDDDLQIVVAPLMKGAADGELKPFFEKSKYFGPDSRGRRFTASMLGWVQEKKQFISDTVEGMEIRDRL